MKRTEFLKKSRPYIYNPKKTRKEVIVTNPDIPILEFLLEKREELKFGGFDLMSSDIQNCACGISSDLDTMNFNCLKVLKCDSLDFVFIYDSDITGSKQIRLVSKYTFDGLSEEVKKRKN